VNDVFGGAPGGAAPPPGGGGPGLGYGPALVAARTPGEVVHIGLPELR
jgi:succinate-semialdehyde dehydrogenase/glutarate-semialdehyde dehydrogenase